jgi:hypothetical protein
VSSTFSIDRRFDSRRIGRSATILFMTDQRGMASEYFLLRGQQVSCQANDCDPMQRSGSKVQEP